MRRLILAILAIVTVSLANPVMAQPEMVQTLDGLYRVPYTEAPLPLPPPYWYSWGLELPYYGAHFGDHSPEYMKRKDPRYVPSMRDAGGGGGSN
jgi:hypothetical protein